MALPNAEVPKDEDVRDLLAITLFDNGLQARTYNGKIVTLYHSKLAKSSYKKHQEQREKIIDANIMPLVSQASGLLIGALMTAFIGKFIKK